MLTKIKRAIKFMDYIDFYVVIGIVLFGLFVITNMILKSNILSYLTQHDVDGNDYFNLVFCASDPKNLYNLGPGYPYPALASVYYYLLYRFLGYDAVSYIPKIGSVETLFKMYTEQDAILVYLFYNFVILILLIVLVFLFLDGKSFAKKICASFLILCSWPYLFNSIRSGNLAAYASIIGSIGIYYWYKNSISRINNYLTNKVNKHNEYLSLLLISIAAGLKIFPCLYGLLYIKDKDIKNTIKLLIIGAIVMFIPFVFFGGIEAIKNFFSYIFNRNGWPFGEVSIGGYVLTIFDKIIPNLSTSDKEYIFHISRHVFLLICLIFFFFAKKKWQSVLCLTAIISSYFPAAYSYNLTYLVAPFLIFLVENNKKFIIEKDKIINIIILILFTLLFSVPFYMYFIPALNHIYAKMFLFVVLPLYILCFVSVICDNISIKKYV